MIPICCADVAQATDCDDPSMGDRLRPLWDFDDLEATRERFLAQLAAETTDAGRAEVLTQLARVESLRNAFERDAGLRIDHFLLSPPLATRLTGAGVDRDVRAREKASDHAPVWITLAD